MTKINKEQRILTGSPCTFMSATTTINHLLNTQILLLQINTVEIKCRIYSNFDLLGKNRTALCPYAVLGPLLIFPDFFIPMYHPKCAYLLDRYALYDPWNDSINTVASSEGLV